MRQMNPMRKLILAASVMAAFVAALLYADAATPPTVRVDTGELAGVTDSSGVTSYKGIPFAAPPIGALRWQPPQAAIPWKGVRQADHFGDSCMQSVGSDSPPWTKEFMTQGSVSEDCLFVNVWTAAKSSKERRPVLVWIYGGGFTEGSTSIAVYDGAALAKKGVILVSMNYRVAALGFLAHPELTQESSHHSSGNYGLLDQIAALQWIHRNIAAFGGDPDHVTIFGQSAGALAVADLMESPPAKGLFVRAIAESGPGLFASRVAALADGEKAGVRYAESKGARSLAELRALPATDFVRGVPGVPSPRGPVADGWVMPLPSEIPAAQAPLIVGFVADDLSLNDPAFGPVAKATVSSYQEGARKKHGDQADVFLKLYPASDDAGAVAMIKASSRDLARVRLDLWAADQLKHSGKIYTYYFDRAIPWPAHPEFGVFHSTELPYVFENLGIFDRPWEPVDRKISDDISSYWVNFTGTGDPNGKNLVKWPAYNAAGHTTMEIGVRTATMPDTDSPARLAFFLDYQSKLAAAPAAR